MSSSFSPFWPLGSLFPSEMPNTGPPAAPAHSLPVPGGGPVVTHQSSASLSAVGGLPIVHGVNLGEHSVPPAPGTGLMPSGPVEVLSAPSAIAGVPLSAPAVQSGGTEVHGSPSSATASSSTAVGMPHSHAPPQPPPPAPQLAPPHEEPQVLMAYFYPAQRWTSGGSQAKGTNWWCDAFGPYQVEQVEGVGMMRGVGPFYMRRQKPGDRQYICSHYKKKPSPCKAMATLKDDGTFIRRRYMHNHFPEPVMPELRPMTPYPPYPHHLPPPTFEQVASITLGPRYITKDPVLEEFDTFIKMWDAEKNEMKEVKITAENCAEIARTAKGVEVNGKMVYRCPVESCDRMYTQRASVVLHMQMHVRGKRCKYARVAEKLCPLCREDQGTHSALVRHIVDEHNTRIECTEHEFETADDFRTWKLRTEQETLSSFRCRRKPYGNKGVKGWYDCCRTGSTHAEKEGARLRRVGVECPATMIVGETNGRITVTYWRTHIGHAPSIIDLRFTPEQRQWMQEMIDKGHKVNSLIAQGAKLYLGGPLTRLNCLTQQQIFNVFKKFDGKPKDIDVKIHHYDYGNVDQIRVALAKMIRDGLDRQSTIGQKRRLQRKAMRDEGRDDTGEAQDRDMDDIEEEELRSGDDDELFSGDEAMDEAKDEADCDSGRPKGRKMAGVHRQRLTDEGEQEAHNSEQEDDNEEHDDEREDVDNKFHGCNHHDDRVVLAQDVMLEKDTGCYYVLSRVYPRKKKEAAPGVRARGGEITHVVFPRKAAHEKCELICERCQVCVHRYGCTCKAYMLLDKMCKHIHRVASCVGPPSKAFIDPDVVKEDTIGMPEALRRLRRLNYRERMKDLMPLADELIELLKSDHNVDLDQLEELLRSGLALMRTSKPVQKTRDDEARNGAQPMEARKAWELRCCPKLPRPKNFAFITANDWRMYTTKLDDEIVSGTVTNTVKDGVVIKEEIAEEIPVTSASNENDAGTQASAPSNPSAGSGRRKQTLRGVPAPGTLVRKPIKLNSGQVDSRFPLGRFVRNGVMPLKRPFSHLIRKPPVPVAAPPPASPSPSPPPTPPPKPPTKPKISDRAARHAKRQAKRRALDGSPDSNVLPDVEVDESEKPADPETPPKKTRKSTKVGKVPREKKTKKTVTTTKSTDAVVTKPETNTLPTLTPIEAVPTQANATGPSEALPAVVAPQSTAASATVSPQGRIVPRAGLGIRPSIIRVPPSIVRRNAKFSMPAPRRISQIGLLRTMLPARTAPQTSAVAKPSNEQTETSQIAASQSSTEAEMQPQETTTNDGSSKEQSMGQGKGTEEGRDQKREEELPEMSETKKQTETSENATEESEMKPLLSTIKSEILDEVSPTRSTEAAVQCSAQAAQDVSVPECETKPTILKTDDSIN